MNVVTGANIVVTIIVTIVPKTYIGFYISNASGHHAVTWLCTMQFVQQGCGREAERERERELYNVHSGSQAYWYENS